MTNTGKKVTARFLNPNKQKNSRFEAAGSKTAHQKQKHHLP
jgi:hypothetical protein